MPKIFLLRHALDLQSLDIQRSAKSVQNEDIDELEGNEIIQPGARNKVPVSPGIIAPTPTTHNSSESQQNKESGALDLVKNGESEDKAVTGGSRPGFRTLAARKAYDEPLDISIERKAAESRYSDEEMSPPAPSLQEDKPVNLVVPKRLHWNHHGLLSTTHKLLAPPPPSIKPMVPLPAPSLGPPPPTRVTAPTWQKHQDQPVDFSTKRTSPLPKHDSKHQVVPSHYRRPPPHPRRMPSREAIFHRNLLVLILRKIRENPEQGRAIVRMLMHVCRLQTRGCTGNSAPPSSGTGQGSASTRAAGGGGTHSSAGGNHGATNYSGFGSGGSSAGSARSGGSSAGSSGGSPHSVRSNSTENEDTLFDPSLEFSSIDFDLPATRKWLHENPDFNPLKILDNISLKSAFGNSGEREAVPKPPPDSSIDRDTANILQLAVPVPDPSATFLDIGTDFGPMSMYEDDPFNLEQVNPSNFILPDTNPSPLQPSMTTISSATSATPNSHSSQTFEQLKPAAIMLPHHLAARHHQEHHHLTQSSPPGPGYSSLMSGSSDSNGSHSLYGGHLASHQIKMEPVFIKQEVGVHHSDCGSHCGSHHGCQSSLADPLNEMNPMSPVDFDRMPATPPGKGRKRSYSMAEEEDLTNVPSLQMRIQILQQRFGIPKDAPLELINGGHGIKNPMASDSPDRVEKLPPIRSDTDPNKMACRVCGKAFTLQRLLNRHMKCHSDTKRYLCTFCGKGFNDTFDLKRHTRTHTGVRPYKCNLCEKSFTQRCSLESHCLKVHGVAHNYEYKQRRSKVYVCEDCGHTTKEPEVHYVHLKETHPYSPALMKFYDKRHFKFGNNNFTNMLLTCN